VSAEDTIKIGYIEFPPLFSTVNGIPQGELIALTHRVLEKAHLKGELKSYPVKRMTQLLVDGGLDLWVGLSTIPDFKNRTLVGATKLSTITLRSYFLGKTKEIREIENLRGHSVIVIQGYSYGGLISQLEDPKNGITLYRVVDHNDGMRALNVKRADYFFGYEGVVNSIFENAEINDLHSVVISSFDAYFVYQKNPRSQRSSLQNLKMPITN